ncbi:hypothetical protein Bbelb_446500 [Branchiostoma belcheri]|nr:hypothetical protein Bbelb_446500 [Branchiostoma belcheri]
MAGRRLPYNACWLRPAGCSSSEGHHGVWYDLEIELRKIPLYERGICGFTGFYGRGYGGRYSTTPGCNCSDDKFKYRQYGWSPPVGRYHPRTIGSGLAVPWSYEIELAQLAASGACAS